MTLAAWAAVALALAQVPQTSAIRGVVRDAQTGEPLARVRIQLTGAGRQAITGDGGEFTFADVAPGTYTLQASTVGYRLARKDFELAGNDSKEFEIALSPDSSGRIDSVEVRAGAFETLRAESPSELTLTGSELKNLASVLADDPLRAVQAMPGVTSNDDFSSWFSLRGAPYRRIGVYLDDVLLHSPFHTVQGVDNSGSLAVFNGDMLEDLALFGGAPPARYGDRTAGALEMRMRDGSRSAVSVRGTASASNAGLMAEGPLGAAGRGSWMAGIRKSYLQYIIARTSSDPTLAFGFWDAQGRATCDVTSKHNVTLSLLEAHSGLDRSDAASRSGVNSVIYSAYRFTLANMAWRYTPNEGVLAVSRAAWVRERYRDGNRDSLDLARGYYGEWVWNTSATVLLPGRNALDAGWSMRRRRDDGAATQYRSSPYSIRRSDGYRGGGLLAGGFAQQALALASGRVRLQAGGRWDHDTANGLSTLSPQASLAFLPRPSTRVQLGWGEYSQFPELRWLYAPIGGRGLLAERAIHCVAALEQRIGERSRVRVEAYQRLDRDLLFRPMFDARLVAGRPFGGLIDAPILNSMRGYARGAEVLIQTRSANRFTGWVSYALGYVRVRDGATGNAFPADEDQRHTVNSYVSYRVRPSVNLSLKWLYGSGFPVPGFFRREGAAYYLSGRRNTVRLGPYHRADVRVNKAYAFDRWKLTLYGEVVNVLNHHNYRCDNFSGYNAKTAQAYIAFDRMFPVLPSVGVMLEF
jgi:hypothetical protein